MVDDHVKRKILLLGDGAVGKTSLIRRFVVDKFSDDYITTIGTKVTKKDLRLESPGKATDMTFMIWGFLGLAKAMIARADAKITKGEAVDETWNPFIAVTDQIIVDFCEFMGGQEAAMPIVRQQITRAGIDVKAPTKEGLRLAIEYLAEAESSFRNAADVEASKLRRFGWIKKVS